MEQHKDAGTRERLLCAAREVFAARGVKEATVRDICALAQANVAAVNYHYGGKDRLFMACLLYTSPSPRDRQKSRMPSSA